MAKGKRTGRGNKAASRHAGDHGRSINSVLVQQTLNLPDQRQKWLPKYEAELGLRPLRAGATNDVNEAWCKFCVSFGRENAQPEKQTDFASLFQQKQRKKTSNIKTFSSFRRDNIVKHLLKQHPIKWAAFNTIPVSDEARRAFFRRASISTHLSGGSNTVLFKVPRQIVDLIQRMLSNESSQSVPDIDFGLTDDNIGSVPISNDFLEREDGDYEINIQNRLQFETVLRCINTTASFRSVTRLFVIFGEAFGSMKLGKPSEKVVGRYARFVVAINLTAIRTILSAAWAFSMMVDGATHQASGYLDVRVAFTVNRSMHNIHLCAIPMANRAHTASNYADLVLDVLDCVGGDSLLRKLIGITSDGAATMLGCRQGFAVRIRHACERLGGTGIAVNWCGSHQLNLAVGTFLDQLDLIVTFRSCLGAEISFTRTHESVRAAVGQCPTYATTRWESIHDACHFLAENYESLIRHQVEKKAPTLGRRMVGVSVCCCRCC
jgi:hypothetical protein